MKIEATQAGVGLIEVMVALLLLGVAVLGFSAMQMSAIKATDESLMRTRSLTIMRGGAETMRTNPSGIAAFKAAINGTSDTLSIDEKNITKDSCVTSANTAPTAGDSCNINQLATRDGLLLKSYARANDINIGMVPNGCPGTSGKQELQCFVASWGDTTVELSDTESKACAKANGSYKNGAECFIMEAY
ncbi:MULTISPECIES: type IV pilus modification protein PilV [Psychrobacter]|uniref:Type IV fimbrial biogenesis protein PilV n=1 Tax=Psychrobacter alimentarius TaxID=261164 RepID=A0ABN4MZ11_9GAMM|nr:MULTISPECIES: type IV pilus modification protein PilV [Psychrobacter]AMT95933.1 Type IV fimbrial biogenesis protein PilV [Psychrobacter alimentarius]QCB31648.1 type IV pilus modification protein PilV [Psychrobacter sp. PAMC27889]